MTETWDIITSISNNNDPYKNFKSDYNQMLLGIEKPLDKLISQKPLPFDNYLYASIIGNIIDIGPSHEFESDNWLKLFEDELNHIELIINHSKELFQSLKKATTLLYIGDNCGEIVLDKMFVAYLNTIFPDLSITFSVRGKPILNDATLDDAEQIGLSKITKTISNGENTPGIIISKTSNEFKEIFNSVDVIIAKGQGNYEGLNDFQDPRFFHLFMVKCPLIASIIGVPIMSKICLRQN
jgi:uncharacterized protein with ATP-grasp and redox domains